MITNLNIRGYINFLDLLQKWTSLPNEEIRHQLQNLYTSWQLSLAESNQYEHQYLEAIQAALPKTEPASIPQVNVTPHQIQPHQTQEARPYVPQKKGGNFLMWLLGLIGFGCVIGIGIWLMQSRNDSVATNVVAPLQDNSVSVAPAVVETPIANFDSANKATEIIATDSAMDGEDEIDNPEALTEIDNQNINSIKQLMVAEEERDFDKIYSYYSPSIEKYWDINYPTRDELQTRFTKVWQRSSNPKHYNVEVRKIAENKYVASGLYEFFQVKTNSKKEIFFQNVFAFDENGKVVLTNEIKGNY
jgi:hypothetical protein